jgi:ubiquinone/menaquinone biosynthesis C-methylase UbiE
VENLFENPKSALSEWGLLAYSHLRSANYQLQYGTLQALALFASGKKPHKHEFNTAVLKQLLSDFEELLARDVKNIREGLYPLRVLQPESPLQHFARIPKILGDAWAMNRRRLSGRTAIFRQEAKRFLPSLPKYYQRNFHFQTDGYLSRKSADLYDHQVEVLFGGTADPMRRMVIEPLGRKFRETPGGEGLHFLELGAGSGSTTRFVRMAFPQAKITLVDLSEPYLKKAQRNLRNDYGLDFVQSKAERLPFRARRFDAVYSVFLFHELPLAVRKKVMTESLRVLKPGGSLVALDSLQRGDLPVFDPVLGNFAHDYHEPFYRNYIAHPLSDLFQDEGLTVEETRAFLAKVLVVA